MNNVLTVDLSVGNVIVSDNNLWQYDYGQVIAFTGVELPETFEVHFGNDQDVGKAKQTLGINGQVAVPDEYLVSGQRLYAWIFLHTGQDDGETEYRITIPVRKRPAPDPTEPTPVEQDIITQAIAALNDGITRSETAAENAEAWAVGQRNGVDVPPEDDTYHNNAKYYAGEADASATDASNSASDASGYANAASNSADSADRSASSAEGYASSASGSASDAALSEEKALEYAERAEQAATTAGYLDMEIDENGHLIYTRTDQVDVDFALDSEGHLVMEGI